MFHEGLTSYKSPPTWKFNDTRKKNLKFSRFLKIFDKKRKLLNKRSNKPKV